MKEMISEIQKEKLKNIFQNIGSEYGYETVDAEFLNAKDFKIRWQRGIGWADFHVSDYLADAPQEVIEGLARNLFDRITGKVSKYDEKLEKWISAPEFTEQHQATYLGRSRNLALTCRGDYKNLEDSLERLIKSGLIKKDQNVFISWTKNEGSVKAGNCSVLMKVISLNKALDGDKVPDYVIDYCLYCEYCHLLLGLDPSGEKHEKEYGNLISLFELSSESEYWLKEHEMIV